MMVRFFANMTLSLSTCYGYMLLQTTGEQNIVKASIKNDISMFEICILSNNGIDASNSTTVPG